MKTKQSNSLVSFDSISRDCSQTPLRQEHDAGHKCPQHGDGGVRDLVRGHRRVWGDMDSVWTAPVGAQAMMTMR